MCVFALQSYAHIGLLFPVPLKILFCFQELETMLSIVLLTVLLCSVSGAMWNNDYERLCGRRLTILVTKLCAASGCMANLLHSYDLQEESQLFQLFVFFYIQ